jgi:hypothetical protein
MASHTRSSVGSKRHGNLIAERIAAQEAFSNRFVAEWVRGELGEVEMLAADPVTAERQLSRTAANDRHRGGLGERRTS